MKKYIRVLVFYSSIFTLVVFTLLLSSNFCTASDYSINYNKSSISKSSLGTLSEDILCHKLDSYSGIDVTALSYSAYVGATWTPLRDLDAEGLRFRVSGGIGRYAYDGMVKIADQDIPVQFTGDVASVDILAGYQVNMQPVIAKVFLGANYAQHHVSPNDVNKKVKGEAWGLKTQIELWWTITDQFWFSSDLSYATSFDDFWSQMRVGYKASSWLSLGPELAVLGNKEYVTGRAGGFARVQTKYGDITLAGGVSGTYEEDPKPYISLSVYKRF